MDSLRLAQLMCSRLCHDLITPVGAISTGLEIIEESEGDIDPELMSLTCTSAKNAAQRLVYYRAAFGFSSLSTYDSIEKIIQVIKAYLLTNKINLTWSLSGEPESDMIKDFARTIINIIGVISETAPYGGNLNLEFSCQEDGMKAHFSLTGDLVGLKKESKQALLGLLSEADITSHNVQCYLVHMFLDMKGGAIDITADTKQEVAMTMTTKSCYGQLTGSLF